MHDLTAARKYAQSLFAEAKAHVQLLACTQGLSQATKALRTKRSVQDVLVHPFITPAEKKGVVNSVLGEFKTPLLERFLMLLVEKRRIGLLEAIAVEFQAAVDRFNGVQPLKVRTAMPMAPAQQEQLRMKLEAWLNSKIRMEIFVEPQLIGGVVIETPNHVLDQSVLGQLRRVERQLSI
jgi:F-type H+-transporting ATPase subunit delta